MKLTENFYLSEFTKSQTALRKNIDNTPAEWQIENIKRLCIKVLQPIRDHFGPVIVSSGFRSRTLNTAIGGSNTSEHCYGRAADIECLAVDNLELAKWIRDTLKFNQLILEMYTIGDPRSGWVHVSYSSINKNSVLTAYLENNRVKYKVGLVE